jgi:hypothetical protein
MYRNEPDPQRLEREARSLARLWGRDPEAGARSGEALLQRLMADRSGDPQGECAALARLWIPAEAPDPVPPVEPPSALLAESAALARLWSAAQEPSAGLPGRTLRALLREPHLRPASSGAASWAALAGIAAALLMVLGLARFAPQGLPPAGEFDRALLQAMESLEQPFHQRVASALTALAIVPEDDWSTGVDWALATEPGALEWLDHEVERLLDHVEEF